MAVDSFLAGRVLVSYGLIAELIVDGKYRSGDLASVDGDELSLDIRVLGPHWTEVSRVQLYSNGQLVREESLALNKLQDRTTGVPWQGTWKLPRPRHDVHLVAIAIGPGVSRLAWPTAKPYQPTSPDWQPNVLGISGAVWIDADSDGRRTSAREYAQRAWSSAGGDPAKLIAALADDDAPTASQAAHLWRTSGRPLDSNELIQAERAAPQAIRDGFRAYRESWEENVRSRLDRP